MNGPISNPNVLGDWLVFEEEGSRYSRDNIVVKSGAGKLITGAVLGMLTVGAATAAAVAGNTGTGTMGAVTVGAGAIPGVYRLTVLEAVSGAGAFEVEDPNGVNIGNGKVGTAYNHGGLSFTLADGTPDYLAGDAFTITVAEGSDKYLPYNPDATDGSEVAAGILVHDVDATSADQPAAAVVRFAHIAPSRLTYAAGVSSDEKAAALASLKLKGILALREV